MEVTINVETLREAVKQECYGACFGGGFGGGMVEASDIEYASPQQLADIAVQMGIDITRFVVD